MTATPTLPTACAACNRPAAGSTIRSRHRSLEGIIEYRECICGEVAIVLEPWEQHTVHRSVQRAPAA